MKINRLFIYSFLFIAVVLFSSCSGSRSTLKFKKLAYPVSLSYSLYDRNGEVVSLGKGLVEVTKFEFKRTLWSTGWSFIPLSNNSVVDERINQIIQENRGDGAVKIEMDTDSCRINNIPVFSFLPVWPGCFDLTVRGIVVRKSGNRA